jgi:inner membrane protein
MDSLTQAALGAAIGEAALSKKIGNKGAVLGAIIATIPDLDIALYLFYDKFEMLSIHRGFSHSIVFSILGAFLIAYVLQRIKWTKQISYQRLWILTWLALFTHMLLDAFTACGTQLFLPFSNAGIIGFYAVTIVQITVQKTFGGSANDHAYSLSSRLQMEATL